MTTYASKVYTDNKVAIYRCNRTGIARLEKTPNSTGTAQGLHPSIDGSGSIEGMKSLGHWKEGEVTERAFGFIYNINRYANRSGLEDEYYSLLEKYCECSSCKKISKTILEYFSKNLFSRCTCIYAPMGDYGLEGFALDETYFYKQEGNDFIVSNASPEIKALGGWKPDTFRVSKRSFNKFFKKVDL